MQWIYRLVLISLMYCKLKTGSASATDYSLSTCQVSNSELLQLPRYHLTNAYLLITHQISFIWQHKASALLRNLYSSRNQLHDTSPKLAHTMTIVWLHYNFMYTWFLLILLSKCLAASAAGGGGLAQWSRYHFTASWTHGCLCVPSQNGTVLVCLQLHSAYSFSSVTSNLCERNIGSDWLLTVLCDPSHRGCNTAFYSSHIIF